MATHSSILTWEIPWTEEPGGLQSMGLQELDTTEHACTHTINVDGSAVMRDAENPKNRAYGKNRALKTSAAL